MAYLSDAYLAGKPVQSAMDHQASGLTTQAPTTPHMFGIQRVSEHTLLWYRLLITELGRNIEVHCMTPAFMSESSQWNVLLGSVGITAALGLAYFANNAGYLGFLTGLM